MEYLTQIIAAVVLLVVFYVYVALAYVLMFVVNFWPVVLVFGFVLAIILFTIRGKKAGTDH
jgi:hypothetical protein